MAKFDYDMVVIGGGAAGLTAASGAGQLGARTLLIENEPLLGGDCLHYGCVPSKTLIASAKIYHQLQNTSKYGLPEISIPSVDFKEISGRIKRVKNIIQKHDSVERFNSLGVEVAFGSPVFTSEHTLEIGGRRIQARKILVATGSTAAVPEIEGLSAAGFITNKEIFSLETLPDSLIVLGAGAIAMEMAQAFSRLGSKVIVIQRSGQILSKEDRDMADIIMQAMEEEGVTFLLNSRIVRVEKNGTRKKVVIEQAGEEQVVEAAEILVALGRKVNTEALGLDAINLKYSSRGIYVDSRQRTNHRHIFAAGDVTGGYQFTHAAGYEAGIVVSNAIFNLPRKADFTWMPWCTYTSPELASIGLNEKAAKKAGIEYTLWTEEFSSNDRALAEEEPGGSIKLLLNSKGKPLGVQIIGAHAGELLSEWVAVVNSGMKMSTLAGAIHPYPTLSEINKRVVGSIFSKKIFSDTTRKALAFIFRYQGSSVKNDI